MLPLRMTISGTRVFYVFVMAATINMGASAGINHVLGPAKGYYE